MTDDSITVAWPHEACDLTLTRIQRSSSIASTSWMGPTKDHESPDFFLHDRTMNLGLV